MSISAGSQPAILLLLLLLLPGAAAAAAMVLLRAYKKPMPRGPLKCFLLVPADQAGARVL
jgi:hypothetical protein